MNTPAVLCAPPLLLIALLAPWLALALFPVLPRRRAAALLPLAPLPALALVIATAPGTRSAALVMPGGFGFGLDATAQAFLLPAALVWAIAGWQAVTASETPGRRLSFAVPWLLALAGSLALILARDLLSFYTAMAVMTFASYGLIVHYRSESARSAGRLYLAMMMAGEVAMFTGVALVMLATAPGTAPGFTDAAEAGPLALALLGTGFATKLGVLGLHAWLPRAHPQAPAAASAVLSGVMIKAGLLGWWRVTAPAMGAYPDLGLALVVIGLAAAFYGVLRGLAQGDAKTILAWSSVSQMGLVTMLAGASQISVAAAPAAWTALAVFVLHHGLNKGALFLAAGINRTGHPSTRTAAWLLLWPPALALAGAPATSGALAKAATDDAVRALAGGDGLGILLYLSSVASALLMIRLLWCTRPSRLLWPPTAAWRPLAPVATLIVLATTLPWLWFRDTAAAAMALELGRIWGATWPLLLATAAAVAGYHWHQQRPRPRQQWQAPALPRVNARAWGSRQLIRAAIWERRLQQWTTVGYLLVSVTVLVGAAMVAASL